MDYTKFSDEDLVALENEDYQSMSDDGLKMVTDDEEQQAQQAEAPNQVPYAPGQSPEQVVGRETDDRLRRLYQATNEATTILNDPESSPEARQDAQDSIVGFNLEKNQLMSDPKWQQNAKEMEKRSLYDLEDAHQNLQAKAQEFGSGVVLDPVLGVARGAAEVVDRAVGTDLGRTVEKGQEWNDRMVAEARIDAGLDPKEWSGMRTTGNVASEIYLANRLLSKFGTGPTSVGSIFDRAKKLVTGVWGTGATAGGLSGGLQYRPEAGEDYSFLDLGKDTATMAGVGAVGGKALELGIKGASGIVKGVANIPKYAKNIVSGGENDAGNVVRKTLGDKADDAVVKLEQHQDKVPGTKATPAQVLSDGDETVYSALESKVLIPRNPNKNYTAEKQSSAANRKAVEEIEGKGVEAAKKLRDKKAAPHYKAAANDSKTPVKVGATRSIIKSIIRKEPKNSTITDPLREIDNLLVSSKNRLGRETSLTVQGIKSAVDFIKTKIKAKNADGSYTHHTGTLLKVKKSLEKQLMLASKDYTKATAVFKEYSIPYNQAVVGEKFRLVFETATKAGKSGETAFLGEVVKLQNKINPKTDKPYLDALSPSQRERVSDVMLNLKRKFEVAEQAKRGSRTMKSVINPPEIPATGVFNPKWQVFRGLFNRLLGRRTEKGLQEASDIIANQDLKAFAKMIKDAKPVELRAMRDFFEDTIGREVAMTGGVVSGELGADESKKNRKNERLKKLIKKDK